MLKRFILCVSVFMIALGLSACGLKNDLYMPDSNSNSLVANQDSIS